MLYNVIDRAIQVHGALGFSTDMPLERMYRAARSARLVDGADEVHKATLARTHPQGLRAGRGADRASADAAQACAQEKFAEYLDTMAVNA